MTKVTFLLYLFQNFRLLKRNHWSEETLWKMYMPKSEKDLKIFYQTQQKIFKNFMIDIFKISKQFKRNFTIMIVKWNMFLLYTICRKTSVIPFLYFFTKNSLNINGYTFLFVFLSLEMFIVLFSSNYFNVARFTVQFLVGFMPFASQMFFVLFKTHSCNIA